jgi:hypothetical protein
MLSSSVAASKFTSSAPTATPFGLPIPEAPLKRSTPPRTRSPAAGHRLDDMDLARHVVLEPQKIAPVRSHYRVHVTRYGCAKDCDVSMPEIALALLCALVGRQRRADASSLKCSTLVEDECSEMVRQKRLRFCASRPKGAKIISS